jgi:FMN phosphatase YigB (HAD superfamily)
LRRFIDPLFCMKQYGFSDEAQVSAWFSQRPLPDFRTFSPLFSPVDYLLDNPDVRDAASHPVAHFLDFGFKEGRSIKPAPALRAYRCRIDTTAIPKPRVAFVSHIFYGEYVEYFLSRLELLANLEFDVYISCSDSVYSDFADDIRTRVGPKLKAIDVVINKGRNFLPLAVTFVEALSTYDVVCHVHSKESRYSGRKQTEWADYLIAATLGPEDVVRRHIAMIASGCCEVIAPAPFRGLPPWASHTLSNGPRLAALCARLGVVAAEGFMAYPVGGMFWMSGGVMRVIASLGLTADEFPDEPSSHDGEIHHALERLVGILAQGRLAFFDQVTGTYWDPTAAVAAELRRFMPPEDLIEVINDYNFVSFDFFDTLCLRGTGSEERAKERVDFALGTTYRVPRNAVEAELRASLPPGRDVALTEISAELSRRGFERAHQAAALERAWDLESLEPNPLVVAPYLAAINAGKFVYILSDTYYDSGIIREFLDLNDLPHPKAILVSSETGVRKDRGDMWPLLLSHVGFNAVLHVGDNVHSDIQQACDAGVHTFYVSHWRNECLPVSGLSAELRDKLRTNAAFQPTRDIPAALVVE